MPKPGSHQGRQGALERQQKLTAASDGRLTTTLRRDAAKLISDLSGISTRRTQVVSLQSEINTLERREKGAQLRNEADVLIAHGDATQGGDTLRAADRETGHEVLDELTADTVDWQPLNGEQRAQAWKEITAQSRAKDIAAAQERLPLKRRELEGGMEECKNLCADSHANAVRLVATAAQIRFTELGALRSLAELLSVWSMNLFALEPSGAVDNGALALEHLIDCLPDRASGGAERTPIGVIGPSKWRSVQERLIRSELKKNRKFTSLRKLAAKFGCSPGTIKKAIDNHLSLRAWQARTRPNGKPKAQGIPRQVKADTTLNLLAKQQTADDTFKVHKTL